MPCRAEICAIFARNLVTRRGIAGSWMNGRGRILTGSTEVTLVVPVEENGKIREGEGMEVLEVDKWWIWPNIWQQCRKF